MRVVYFDEGCVGVTTIGGKMNEWVGVIVHHLRSLYAYQKNKIMGFGLYKT